MKVQGQVNRILNIGFDPLDAMNQKFLVSGGDHNAGQLDRLTNPDDNLHISILLPTRGRPRLLQRFLATIYSRSERPELVEMVIYADDDDPQSHKQTFDGLDVRTIVGPPTSMGRCNSICLEHASGDIIILCNDDVMIQTPGWDTTLRRLHAAHPDGIYLAYPNDLFKGRKLCSFPILSRTLCRVIGDPYPQAYQGAFIDYHLLDIFKRLERRRIPRIFYLEDVIFEHLHHRAGKSEIDTTYARRNRFVDDETFLRLRQERSDAAIRLFASIRHGPVTSQPPREQSGVSFFRVFLGATLFDGELPVLWRLRLFVWFVARFAARGLQFLAFHNKTTAPRRSGSDSAKPR